ncbi:hypothetical protein [Ruegeria sp. HKCCD6109]|nr:hypothetical protein [Ruegeria sp. HKCCD6109]NOD65738.1 hypothetical protein [Ruegeria sp. HKCCD6109]
MSIPPLSRSLPITDSDGKPSMDLLRYARELERKLAEYEARLAAGGL